MQAPGRDLAAHVGQLPRGHGGQKPGPGPPANPVIGFPGTERVSAERERYLTIVQAPPIVLAVHYPGFIGVQLQPNAAQPTFNRFTHLVGLALGHTVDHRIVCKTLEPDRREFPKQPHVQPVVGSPGGSHPRAPTERSVNLSIHSALLTLSSGTRASMSSERTARAPSR